ncbi:protein COBRA-like isoform X3 [Punica granatum]|uniref:Protein COBRA-like isoform X3 n=1 Tax=Punica granatum TaxID=22663 RepID=A0A6P8CEQ0_PUNGR|nr:protein COBRA-like isoform X3 [Punica granatum]
MTQWIRMARVTVQNYYQYRLVDKPGWTIGWTWANAEVIWSMYGAFATQQGNCSNHMFQVPHSCKKDPVILDLTPEAAPENRTEGCCQSGLLSAWSVVPSKSFSSFEIQVGGLGKMTTVHPPVNLTLLGPGPGYTCGPVSDAEPTVSSDIGGKRKVQVFRTWKSTCTYSAFLANKSPVCCASLSSFYNPTVTSCPMCSCGCSEAKQNTSSCISPGNAHPNSRDDTDVLQCTDHNCPVRVHWHVKNNYADHWRVKLTVSNYNYKRNYSNWNILVQHPGFNQSSKAFSFNSTMLPTVGFEDEVALFWGYDSYNNELLQANHDQLGSVTTEILLEKDADSFTLSNGWAFPRKIYFNGENCQMPLPDTFPMLPNHDVGLHPPPLGFLLLLTLLSLKQLLD